MKLLTIFALLFVVPVLASADDKDAKTLAQDVLDKGAALFDTRDATAMVATYTDDAQLLWTDKGSSTGEIKVSIKKDHAEIESLYRDLFKDAKEKTASKNTVDYARFVGPDVLVIQGVFQPNVEKADKFPFVQTRVKQGEKWLIKTLQLYVIAQD
jgi:hypothetical protein